MALSVTDGRKRQTIKAEKSRLPFSLGSRDFSAFYHLTPTRGCKSISQTRQWPQQLLSILQREPCRKSCAFCWHSMSYAYRFPNRPCDGYRDDGGGDGACYYLPWCLSFSFRALARLDDRDYQKRKSNSTSTIL